MSKWSSTFQNIALGTIAVGTGAWFLHEIRKYLYRGRENADELHHVQSEDGVQLGLWRYRPKNGSGEPVLLVHGFGLNHRHLDLNERLSLALHLKRNGYDCWAVDLRGRGASELPDEPWNFDDYVEKDFPAVIDYILRRTGHSKLHWGGHSMGAMLFYAFAGSNPEYRNKIASAVAGQGPFHGRSKQNANTNREARAIGFENIFLPVMEVFRRLRIPWTGVVRFGGFWYPQLRALVPDQLIHLVFNPKQITHETLKQVSVRIVERVSPQVLGQFLDWSLARHWSNNDGTTDYRDHISDIDIPTRIIAGSIDKLCPPHNQQAGYEELGSSEKDLVVAGLEEGFEMEYSHLDFVHGEHAPNEIYPLFDDWYERFNTTNTLD